MALKFRKKIILAKIEPIYGTDSVPTGAANAILTHNLSITPLEADLVSRDLDRPTLGNDLQLHVGARVMAEFDVEWAGSGTTGAGTIAPAFGPVLRGCGLAETVDLTVSAEEVRYLPISASEESLSCYFFIDGQKHGFTGARGSFSLKADAKGIPYMHFKFIGLWVDPASVATPAGTFTAFMTPVPVSKTATPTFTIHELAAIMFSFDFDQANDTKYRNAVTLEQVDIVDRKPAGKVTMEAPALSVKNFFTIAKANTTGALALVHGTVAGNICKFDAPNAQVLKPAYAEYDGVAGLNMDLSFVPSTAGDDEFKLTFK